MKTGTLNRFEWLKAVNRSDLLSRAKVTAAALAVEFCNDETGRLDPGLDTLADATGQTIDTVKRAIRDLTEGGWLARTEGRGRGNKTEYTLLSPGKVIAISSAKKGAPVHLEKGGTGALLSQEKGAPVHGKGGTGALSHNIAKQTLNKGERPAWDRFRNHQFAGNRDQGPRYLTKEDDWHKLNGWSDWLADRGLPPLCQLPISQRAVKKTVFALPYRDAPTDPARCSEAYDYFTTLMDAGALAYAAQ